MKSLGIFLIVIGSIWAIIAFNMDTSISTGLGSIDSNYGLPTRVNNLGLMAERQNHLILSGLTVVIGILLFGFGSIANNSSNSIGNKIACPFCAEQINVEAKFCRFCQKELPANEDMAVKEVENEVAYVSDEGRVVYKYCNNCHCLNNGKADKCSRCDSPLEA